MKLMPRNDKIITITIIIFYVLGPVYSTLLEIFSCGSVTVVPIFPPLLSPVLPTPTSHIQFSLPHPLSLSMGALYMFFDLTRPLLSLITSPLSLPSGYCQFILYFHVSGSILLACLFC